MALTTLAAIALGVSAAAGVAQGVEARNARKSQEANLRAQQEKAKAEAALKQTKDATGADVVLGTADAQNTITDSKKKKRTGTQASVLTNVGGVKVSKRVGL